MQNVRDHGATGDGRTDDTAAIRKAADAAAPGGTVYFPGGTYRVGANNRTPLQYPTDGSWRDLTWTGDDGAIIRMAGGQTKWHFVFELRGEIGETRFESLTIDGNKGAQEQTIGENGGLGIKSEASGTVVMRDCIVKNAHNAGLKLEQAEDGDIQWCRFHNNGYRTNGGHAISPNQTTQTTTTIRDSLFTEQGGVDVDVGQRKAGKDWQTVLIERCLMRDSPRGSLKICPENDTTTVRKTAMLGNQATGRSSLPPEDHRTEIPVKMNPTDADIGTVRLEDVVIDGAQFPAIDLPCPGRLELDEVAIQNAGRGGQRDGAGIYTSGMDLSGTRVSIHGTKTAVNFAGTASGAIEEVIHEGQAFGRDNGIVKSHTVGDPLSPTVPLESEVGPRSASDRDSDSDSDEQTETPTGAEPTGDYVRMQSAQDADGGNPYRFTVDGTVTKGPDADDNDAVTKNDDGTVTVSGQGGWGGVDDFYVEGEILEPKWDPAKWTMYRAGETVPPEPAEEPDDDTSDTRKDNDGNVGDDPAYGGITFDRTVDAVADLGLDNTGGAIVDTRLQDIDAGTKVEFPSGKYKIQNCWIRESNVGLVAKEGADVTFVCTDNDVDYSLLLKTGGDHVLSGITFDRNKGEDITFLAQTGDLFVEDVHMLGVVPKGVEGFSVAIEDPDGTGTIRNLRMVDGGPFDSACHGLFVGQTHAGRLDIIDCEVSNWPDNGVYASSPGYIGSYRGTENSDRGDGEVHIRGGVFTNNNISNVRIGSTNATVRDAYIGAHPNPSGDSWDSREHDIQPRSGTEPEPVVNTRGIWVANRTNLLVENCDVVMETGKSSGAICVKSYVGTAVIKNTRVRVDSEECFYAVDVSPPSIDWPDTKVTFDSVSITGQGGSQGAAVRVRGRPDTTFTNCCLKLDGDGQNGIVFEGGGHVETSAITVDGTRVIGGDAPSVSPADACPLPRTITEGGTGEGSDPDPVSTVYLERNTTIRAVGDAPITYELEASGPIASGTRTVPEDYARTVSGTVPPGEEDWFWFGGELVSVDLSGGDARLFIGAEDVTDEWTNGTGDGDGVGGDDTVSDGFRELSIICPGASLEYGFRIDGTVREESLPGSATWFPDTKWVHGTLQPSWGARRIEFTGRIHEVNQPPGSTVRVDGTLLEETDDPVNTDAGGTDPFEKPPIGGGPGFDGPTVTEATTVASSLDGLRQALSDATAGDLVWLDADVTVSSPLVVPRGVTLASGRGQTGATATIRTTKEATVVQLKSGARLTGVDIEGPHRTYRDWDGYPCGTGVECTGTNVTVENCDVHGFAYTGVNTSDDTRIEYSYIHHNPQNGLGYGVLVDGGRPEIRACRFDYNRHSVAAESGPGGYLIEDCWFGPQTIHHVIDHHGPTADSQIHVRRCTFEAVRKIPDRVFYHAGHPTEAIRLREGGTAGETIVENCWFFHPSAPSPTGAMGEALYFGSGNSWEEKNATLRNNHFGSDEPEPTIGCPR